MMDAKYKVVLGYLEQLAGSFELPSEDKSKEDKGKQTSAVEKLIKEAITQKMPGYSDKVFSVGGFVRDRQLGKNPKDLDLVVDDPDNKMKSAEVFAKEFASKIGLSGENNPHPLKETYGIWGIALIHPRDATGKRPPFIYDGVDVSGYVIEITPPRREGPYNEQKREPSFVEYTTREDDAKRRDLTVNAIYQNVVTGEIEDYVGGMKDLKEKTLRPPEHPEGISKIYEDDPLRILRLIRFSGKLPGFKVPADVEKTVKDFIKSPEGHKLIVSKVAKDRIRDEFENIITHPDGKLAAQGLELMKDYGLLKYLSPHLEKMLDIFHDEVYHSGESVWQHTLEVLEKTPPTRLARLGALFHDVGKIETAESAEDSEGRQRVHFKGHEDRSALLIPQIMKELKFSTQDIASVTNIAHAHMGLKRFDEKKKSKQLMTMRLFIEKLHKDMDDALAVIKADSSKDPADLARVHEIEQLIKKQKEDDLKSGILVTKQKNPEYVDPITGDELEKEFGIKNEQIGVIKNKLREMLLKGTFDNIPDHERAERAKKQIRSLITDEDALSKAVEKYREQKKERNFYKVR